MKNGGKVLYFHTPLVQQAQRERYCSWLLHLKVMV